ncbi:HD domain-containing protein [Candidatus Sumerlaeota bacterium]|nr:HD domain-containing protein [Candidatus Sumerlaeota bacterium]
MQQILYCHAGQLRGQRRLLDKDLTVGRETYCDIILDDPKVSRHHGTFQLRDGKIIFVDNNSTNGTMLNGRKITEAEIRSGDIIKFGSSEFGLLEEADFRTINFVNSDSQVMGVVNAGSVRADSLANKFQEIFEYYKENQPQASEAEQYELVRTQRMLNGLKTLYSISQTMTRVMSLPELFEHIAKNMFEFFAAAENLVILLEDEEKEMLIPRFATSRDPGRDPTMNISKTVLDRAIKERCTLTASDVTADSRLSNSDSIVDFQVKSVMCAPLVSGVNVIGALYLDNRLSNVRYDAMDAELLTAFANQTAVAIENSFLCDSLQQHYHQTLQTLVNAIEAKDAYTLGHSMRVGKYATGIARMMGLSDSRVERIKAAADIHDIGKIGLKEGLINKPGRLTDTEYNSVKEHVDLGEKILRPSVYLRDVLPFIRGHHERWDGTGYPDRLRGEECPLEGRILAMADSFDAMTSQRSYNKPISFDEAFNRIKSGAGTQFDPQLVEVFERYYHEVLISELAQRSETTSQKTVMSTTLEQ